MAEVKKFCTCLGCKKDLVEELLNEVIFEPDSGDISKHFFMFAIIDAVQNNCSQETFIDCVIDTFQEIKDACTRLETMH